MFLFILIDVDICFGIFRQYLKHIKHQLDKRHEMFSKKHSIEMNTIAHMLSDRGTARHGTINIIGINSSADGIVAMGRMARHGSLGRMGRHGMGRMGRGDGRHPWGWRRRRA